MTGLHVNIDNDKRLQSLAVIAPTVPGGPKPSLVRFMDTDIQNTDLQITDEDSVKIKHDSTPNLKKESVVHDINQDEEIMDENRDVDVNDRNLNISLSDYVIDIVTSLLYAPKDTEDFKEWLEGDTGKSYTNNLCIYTFQIFVLIFEQMSLFFI